MYPVTRWVCRARLRAGFSLPRAVPALGPSLAALWCGWRLPAFPQPQRRCSSAGEKRTNGQDQEGRSQLREGPEDRDGRPQVHGLHGTLAALHHSPRRADRRGLRRGARLRRLVHPRMGLHRGERHAGHPRPGDRGDGSLHEGSDALPHLQHLRPDHQGGLLPRPALHRPEGGAVSQEERHRRRRLLRTGGRVLHLRRHQLRHRPEPRPLQDRIARGSVGDRQRGRAQISTARPTPRGPTWATSRATRKATSRSRPSTASRTSAPRCAW